MLNKLPPKHLSIDPDQITEVTVLDEDGPRVLALFRDGTLQEMDQNEALQVLCQLARRISLKTTPSPPSTSWSVSFPSDV